MKKTLVLTLFTASLMAQGSILSNFSSQFADIAEKINPAVVTILTEKTISNDLYHQQNPEGDDLFRFFAPRHPQREFRTNALGSGVIVDAEMGYVLTNNHVVEDAREILVRLLDKREFKAEIVGQDLKSDIAVIKIKGSNLTEINFGNSDKLRVGEWVMAVGSPFSANLSHTVTAGIVSAKGRGNIIGNREFYEDFIQTDAAINPGNSGGALLNVEGELIGINTAIYSGGFDRSNKGVGFAIPSNMAKKVMNDLIQHGRVIRSWIGVQIQPINDNYAKALKLKSRKGALIADVIKDSPAEKAGLKTGDVIQIFDGIEINSVDHLRNAVSSSTPNLSYNLKIVRNGYEKKIKIKLEELPGPDISITSTKIPDQEIGLGLKVVVSTPALLRKYGLEENDEGVIVAGVTPNSPAENEGIREGYLITRVGTKTITDAREFRAEIKKAKKNKVILLHLKREGTARYLTLEFNE
ncbi:MAG: Do family serine endopeptidase [Candidatus Neomarinimicrobiota bacterium]